MTETKKWKGYYFAIDWELFSRLKSWMYFVIKLWLCRLTNAAIAPFSSAANSRWSSSATTLMRLIYPSLSSRVSECSIIMPHALECVDCRVANISRLINFPHTYQKSNGTSAENNGAWTMSQRSIKFRLLKRFELTVNLIWSLADSSTRCWYVSRSRSTTWREKRWIKSEK